MQLIPTFKEPKLEVLGLEDEIFTGAYSLEWSHFNRIYSSISIYGAELGSSEIVALETYEQEALYYVYKLLNEVLERNDLEVNVGCYYERLEELTSKLSEFEYNKQFEDYINLIKLDVASTILNDVKIVKQILEYVINKNFGVHEEEAVPDGIEEESSTGLGRLFS